MDEEERDQEEKKKKHCDGHLGLDLTLVIN